MRRAIAAGAAIAAVAAVGPPAAAAAPANILGGDPDPMAPNPNVFKPTSFDHEAGLIANLTWVAGGSHDADAIGLGPDGGPLFRTELTRGSIQVPGTQYLPLGAYPFVCTIHSGMVATLNVNSGTPRPRPEVRLRLQSRTVDQVLKSSSVRVKVNFLAPGSGPVADPDEARVEVKLGKRTIASASAIATKSVSPRLNKQGRKALAGKDKAKLKLSAEVDFGLPASATGRLK